MDNQITPVYRIQSHYFLGFFAFLVISCIGIWIIVRSLQGRNTFLNGLLTVPRWLLCGLGILLQTPLIGYVYLGLRGGLFAIRQLPMTLREHISRRKRRVNLVFFLGFAVFGFSLVVGHKTGLTIALALVGFAISIGAVLFMLFGVRCPKCHEPIGYQISYPGGPFSVSHRIKFCAYCGVSLDSEL